MTWRLENDRTCTHSKHVVLTFVDYPAYRYGYCSDDLARYLDSLGSQQVRVIFEVRVPDAQLGGGYPVKVGTLEAWKSEFEHMGSCQDSLGGVPPAHPWEQFWN
jgi:hypothetical protein